LKKLGRSLFYPEVANNRKKSSFVTPWISECICRFLDHALTSQRCSPLWLPTPSRDFLSHDVFKVFLL